MLTVARIAAFTLVGLGAVSAIEQAVAGGFDQASFWSGAYVGVAAAALTVVATVELAGRRRRRQQAQATSGPRSLQEAQLGASVATIADFENVQEGR